jgi:hypothetical protein
MPPAQSNLGTNHMPARATGCTIRKGRGGANRRADVNGKRACLRGTILGVQVPGPAPTCSTVAETVAILHRERQRPMSGRV